MKLLFIYNANSGKANAFVDTLHKIFRPSTYSCDLCNLSFGIFSEKKQWKKFRKNLEVETEFLHRDEFQKKYASKFGYKFNYPIVLSENSEGLEVFISDKEFAQISSAKMLMGLIEQRLKQ
ncbi:GTPase [Christiangramia fulva]|uniref:GTPase n=1 Tax=Christiangramia fulva TaxID=2126553 RepID=A0A2R3Z1H1_9FLAO|nr:GTPase [Christiangramia fulva]AVR44102.1 GTPase [Christiangramia fulva]